MVHAHLENFIKIRPSNFLCGAQGILFGLSFIQFMPLIPVQFSQFQSTNACNCHLIHSNIFKNIKLLHVSELTGPSQWVH